MPVGHLAVTNEYIATGGLDAESDEVFRQRIKNNLNILSIGTLEYFNQLFQNQDARVLRTFNLGTNDEGKRILSIVTQNGENLTSGELDALLQSTKEFFPITDLNRFGDTIDIELMNVIWFGVNYDGVSRTTGIDFRVQIDDNADADMVRRTIQINISKYLDFRFWRPNQIIEWDQLLRIVQDTPGVRYVPDMQFNPRVDEVVPINQLPRVQNFVMRDLAGNIIFDSGGVLSPVFYPSA